METITVRGHKFQLVLAKDSFSRRALQYKNNIIRSLSKIGVTTDDLEIEFEPVAMKKVLASATWFLDGNRMYYSYKSAVMYVNNLYVVSKVIELSVADLIAGKKRMQDFISDFSEDENVEDMRKEARETLGVSEDELDMKVIDKKYKELAKKFHPDMPTGDLELFKKVNQAHKMIQRELL